MISGISIAVALNVDLTVDLSRGGTDASATSGILSVVIDSVVRRALELDLAMLNDGVREIAAVQRRARQVASMKAG